MADGLLIVDKPAGPTSHDVVARMRRALREPRIGHTGTLDPMATGVLLLVVGKATRLAKFLSGADKSYDAVVRFGFATDTADAEGQPSGSVSNRPMPSREEIDTALNPFRGTFMQQPPAFSAKKIDGQRSYKLARAARAQGGHTGTPPQSHLAPEASHQAPRTAHLAPSDPPGRPALPAPCSVTTTRLEIVSVDGDRVWLSVNCSAGFYIRSLAHDLGERLGVGAHLTALRRTRVGDFGLERAVTLDTAERDSHAATAALVPLSAMLPHVGCLTLTVTGVTRALHGQDIRSIDREPSVLGPEPLFRLLDPAGNLVAVAEPAGVGGALHPSVVLV